VIEGHKRSSFVRTEEIIRAARKAIKTSATKNVRRLAQQIGVSTSTAWKICRHDLSLFSYKMQLSQPLSEDGIGRRYAFTRQCAALLEGNPGVLNVTWFSDEAHLHLDGCINKQHV
jgi:hypothetical protein